MQPQTVTSRKMQSGGNNQITEVQSISRRKTFKMSISYCEKHNIHHDEDYQIECPQCETESTERDYMEQKEKEDPNSLENLLNATGWAFHVSNKKEI